MRESTSSISAALAAAQAGINGLNGKIEKGISVMVGKQLDATKKHFQQQLDGFNIRIGSVEGRQDRQDAIIRNMAEQIAELQKSLAVAAKQPVQSPSVGRAFDRDVDHTIIKAHADGLVNLDKATEELSNWICGSGIDAADFKIEGDAVVRFFTVQFTGLAGPASRRVQKALGCLRRKDGTWTRIRAPAASGNGLVELRVGPDKSPKQIKTEVIGKRIRQALEAALSQHVWRVDRAKGWITAGWSPVLQYEVHPERDSATTVKYNDTVLATLSLARSDLEAPLDAVVRAAPAPEFWL